MVSDNTKADILVTILIIGIIGGIAGGLLYLKNIQDNKTPDVVVDPVPNPNPNPNPNPDNNNNNTNQTNPDNNNDNLTDFEKICAIEPKAEVCIKPIENINGTNKTN